MYEKRPALARTTDRIGDVEEQLRIANMIAVATSTNPATGTSMFSSAAQRAARDYVIKALDLPGFGDD